MRQVEVYCNGDTLIVLAVDVKDALRQAFKLLGITKTAEGDRLALTWR